MQPPSGPEVTGILLAAGAGSRFGGGKLLHTLSGGERLGVRAWRNLRAALPVVIVVVRDTDRETEAVFRDAGASVVPCADAHLGMGHSLACAVRARRQAAGWVIALADMPSVSPGTIRAVAGRIATGAGIVVPFYRGQRGHPVGFSAGFGEQLIGLTGDSGARAILQGNPQALERIDVDDPGVLQDVDTREDARRLESGDTAG